MGSSPVDLNWNSASALWNVAHYKIVGLPMMDFYLDKAEDASLKAMLSYGIDKVLIPHVERIQNMLKEKGLETPSFYQRGKIDDHQISRCVREIVKHGLLNEMTALSNVSDNNVRNLLSDIIKDDMAQMSGIIQYKKSKNWLFDPPSI